MYSAKQKQALESLDIPILVRKEQTNSSPTLTVKVDPASKPLSGSAKNRPSLKNVLLNTNKPTQLAEVQSEPQTLSWHQVDSKFLEDIKVLIATNVSTSGNLELGSDLEWHQRQNATGVEVNDGIITSPPIQALQNHHKKAVWQILSKFVKE